jgi:hypothetical protein
MSESGGVCAALDRGASKLETEPMTRSLLEPEPMTEQVKGADGGSGGRAADDGRARGDD